MTALNCLRLARDIRRYVDEEEIDADEMTVDELIDALEEDDDE